MSKFCSSCGAELKPDEKFCKACGTKVNATPSNIEVNTSAGRYEEDYNAFDTIFKMTGRLNRLRYLKRCLAVALFEMVILGVAYMLFANEWGLLSSFGSIVVTILLVAGQVPYYCLNVRRLHDLDKDATLANILLGLGIVGAISSSDIFSMSFMETLSYGVETIAALYLLFFPGTHGDNNYGADPLG